MPESKLLEIKIKLEALITEREAYIAANFSRMQSGYSLAYTDGHFTDLKNEIEALQLELIK